MMQSADLRKRNHSAAIRRLDLPFDGRVSFQSQVRSRVQVVIEVRSEDATEMSFVENDDMVEALAADRTDMAFAIGILPGRSWSDEYFLDTHMLDARTKRFAVDSIAITNQVARRFVERERFNNLRCGPLSRRRSRDVEVHDLSPVVAKDYEGEKDAECRRGDGKEVNRDDISNMVVQEGTPRWKWRLARTDSVLVHGRLGDDVAEKRELGLDTRRSPQRILTRHSSDQLANLGFDPRASGFTLRLRSAIQLETLPMPSNHGVRLHDEQSGTPIPPNPRSQRPEDPITRPKARCFQLLLQDGNLLSKREILGGKIDSITNQGPDDEDHRAK